MRRLHLINRKAQRDNNEDNVRKLFERAETGHALAHNYVGAKGLFNNFITHDDIEESPMPTSTNLSRKLSAKSKPPRPRYDIHL